MIGRNGYRETLLFGMGPFLATRVKKRCQGAYGNKRMCWESHDITRIGH